MNGRCTVSLRWLITLFSPALILASAAAQDHQRASVPGQADGHVTQATIHDTICQRAYTAKVRPPQAPTHQRSRGRTRGLRVGLRRAQCGRALATVR
jgi:hypothetical protein